MRQGRFISDRTIPPDSAARPSVKRALTPGRRRRVTENDEYASFARRVLRAWACRVAAGDVDVIADMAAAARQLDDAMRLTKLDLLAFARNGLVTACRFVQLPAGSLVTMIRRVSSGPNDHTVAYGRPGLCSAHGSPGAPLVLASSAAAASACARRAAA